MLRCRKSGADQLVRLFLQEYKANMLMPPRKDLPLGTIFVVRGTTVEALSHEDLLTKPLRIVTSDRGGADIDKLRKSSSDKLASDVVARLAGSVLAGLGLGDVWPDIDAKLGESGAHSHSITLHGLSVAILRRDIAADDLAKCRFRTDHAYADGASRYFLTTGTWSATMIELVSHDEKGLTMKLGADVAEAISADGALGVSFGQRDQMLIDNASPLVFGVETMRIGAHNDGLVLLDRQPAQDMRGKGVQTNAGLALIETEGTEDDAFLMLSA